MRDVDDYSDRFGLVTQALRFLVWHRLTRGEWHCVGGSDRPAEAERIRLRLRADVVLPRGVRPPRGDVREAG